MAPLSPDDFNLDWADLENSVSHSPPVTPAADGWGELEALFGLTFAGESVNPKPDIPEAATPAPAPPEPELEELELEDLFGLASAGESVHPETDIPESATPAPEPELEELKLEDLFGLASAGESVNPEPDIPESATPAPEIGVAAFAESRSANPEQPAAMPSAELPLPPLISPQGLWAEIGHLFPASSLSEPVTIPPIQEEIDALSQALLTNDGETIQTLVNQIQENHADSQSIEIFLTATRNWCR